MRFLCKNCLQDFINFSLEFKLANLVNHILHIYTGVRGKIGLKNNKEYDFDPKTVILSAVSIYSTFKDYNKILSCIVKDERSFNLKNFESVMLMHQNGELTINYNEKIDFTRVIEKIKNFVEEFKSQTIVYDDANEEYLDPITNELMNDPVLLPSSKTVLDRKTIETHLLKDQTDPFNRSLLTIDMLVSCSELKNSIEEYKIKKKSSR